LRLVEIEGGAAIARQRSLKFGFRQCADALGLYRCLRRCAEALD